MAALLGLVAIPWCAATAQNLIMQVADVDPLGLANFGAVDDVLDLGTADGIKGDFSYGIASSSVYDSNFFLSEDDPDSEFATILAPWISYRSDPEGGARYSFSASYSPGVRLYQQNSDLNDIDQGGNVSMTFTGSKAVISIYSKYSEIAGTDRLTGVFVSGSMINSGIVGSYQVAPRTSLFGNWSASMSDYQSSALDGATIYSSELGGFWDATGRFSVGPSIRHSLTESDNTGTQDALAMLVNARYRVGERIQLLGALGLEYAESSRDGGDSSLRVTGNLAAAYVLTARLAWTNAIRYATIPSPTDSNYLIQNLSVSTALSRDLTWGTMAAGLDLNFSNYEEVGTVTTSRGIEQNFSGYLSYRRRLFSERVGFESKVRYTENDGKVDWSQVQLSAGLDVQF